MVWAGLSDGERVLEDHLHRAAIGGHVGLALASSGAPRNSKLAFVGRYSRMIRRAQVVLPEPGFADQRQRAARHAAQSETARAA